MAQVIGSLEGFVRKIAAVHPADDEALFYRGHSDRTTFKLLPSILRDDRLIAAEHDLLRDLIATHPSEFSDDKTTLEQLSRAQHYELPTRLLDLTGNPLVGLYFACNSHDNKPGEVIVLRIKQSAVKRYDSDTVSCVANLAHLKNSERRAIDFTLKGNKFNKQLQIDRLLQFIRSEKPHFLPRIVPDDLKGVYCVLPKRNSRRILVQAGAFLLFGMCGDLDTSSPPEFRIERMQVNRSRKKHILQELDRMSINESSLFPELDKAAWYLRRRVAPA